MPSQPDRRELCERHFVGDRSLPSQIRILRTFGEGQERQHVLGTVGPRGILPGTLPHRAFREFVYELRRVGILVGKKL